MACAILSIGQVQVYSGSIDSVALEEHATRVMRTYCVSCHGAETQKGKVVVSHEDLFSGKYADLPGYTMDRRWLISEFIFNEKINRLLNYRPTRKIYGTTYQVQGDSGVHWSPKTEHGNKFRRTITNPFLLPEKVGVRYSSRKRLTTGHLLTMVGNAKRVAGHMSSASIMKAHYPATYALMKVELEQRETLRSRENFLKTYSFMARLLEDIYGEEHEELQPEVVRQEIPTPGHRNIRPTAFKSGMKTSNF